MLFMHTQCAYHTSLSLFFFFLCAFVQCSFTQVSPARRCFLEWFHAAAFTRSSLSFLFFSFTLFFSRLRVCSFRECLFHFQVCLAAVIFSFHSSHLPCQSLELCQSIFSSLFRWIRCVFHFTCLTMAWVSLWRGALHQPSHCYRWCRCTFVSCLGYIFSSSLPFSATCVISFVLGSQLIVLTMALHTVRLDVFHFNLSSLLLRHFAS